MADLAPTCSDCGEGVEAGSPVCGRCGNRLDWPEPVVQGRDDEPPPVPPVPPVPPAPPGSAAGPVGGTGRGLIPAIVVDLTVSSPRGERPVPLDSGDTLEIGRDVGPLTDLCTDNVSGLHARIRVGDDDVVIEDIGSDGRGSTNGTFLNGSRLPVNLPTPLPDGAVVTCGSQPPLTIHVRVTRP